MTEYTGEWWTPDNPDLKIRGTLRIKNFYAVLSFFQSIPLEKNQYYFKPSENFYYYFKSLGKNLYKPDIILGDSAGREITLLKCKGHKTGVLYKAGQSNPSINVPKYYPSAVFIGVHFTKLEDIHFKSLEIYYQHLSEWVNNFGFKISNKGNKNINEITVKYKKPKEIKMYQDKTTSVSIDFQPTESYSTNEIKIGHKVLVKIEHLSNGDLFEKDLSIINYIRFFLAFGMNFPIYPFEIKGFAEKKKIVLKNSKKHYYFDIKIFTSNMLESSKTDKQFFSDTMLFSLKDIAPEIENVINKWFRIMKSSLKEAYNLYLDALYNLSTSKYKFLNLAQAFEAFYNGSYSEEERLIITKKAYNINVYKELIKKFDNDISSTLELNNVESEKVQDLRKNLSNKLEYGNEVSLKKKLMQVMDDSKYKELVNLVVKKRRDKKALAYRIAKIRNDLSHGKEVNNDKVIAVGKKLGLLIKIVLLKTLNFEDEEIAKFLKLNHT